MATKSTIPTKFQVDSTAPIAIDLLKTYTRNPRKGNVGVVAASLKAHGQYRPITVNIGTHTGRKLEVLTGNHTLKAFRMLATKSPADERWMTVLAHFVDVDDDQAARIVVSDNRTSEKGSYDNESLAGLLAGLRESPDGFGATGFDITDLDGLSGPEVTYTDPDDLESGRGDVIISYSIVFDTTGERRSWIDFLQWLKRRDPDSTMGQRLTNYLEGWASAQLQETEES